MQTRTVSTANELNRRSYDAIAALWAASRRDLPALDREYVEAVLADLAPGAPVLDAGCGTGRPIAALAIARDLALTGIDQSPAMLAHAEREFPMASWRLARLEDAAFDGPYAGAFLWDALFHLPRESHAPLLARLVAALDDGARLALTVGGSAHPAFTDTMFDHSFFYDSHPPAVVGALLRALDVVIEREGYLNLPTGGRDKGRYAYVVRKAGRARMAPGTGLG
ncbi:MAG: trans-aconitate 2-methyltransferase [Gammaproteobacteria bacterium]